MKLNYALVDAKGTEVEVLVELDENKLGPTIARLANKARDTKSRRATALDGAFVVTLISETPAAPGR